MTKINSSSKKGGAYSARERTVTYAPQFNFAVGTTVPLAHGLDRTENVGPKARKCKLPCPIS